MAKRYIETKDIQGLTKREVAEKLSATLWNFQRPDAVKNPRDVTKYLFGIQPHPVIEDDYVVEVDDSFSIRKHPQAIASEILELAEGLSTQDKNTLTDYIENNAEPVVGKILNNLRDEIIQYPLYNDIPDGHVFSIDDPVAAIEQTGDESVLEFYECIQGHTKNATNNLSVPALWIKRTAAGDVEVWVQPISAETAYDIGDRVLYPDANGQVWVSQINANTTVPDGDEPYNRYWKPEQ